MRYYIKGEGSVYWIQKHVLGLWWQDIYHDHDGEMRRKEYGSFNEAWLATGAYRRQDEAIRAARKASLRNVTRFAIEVCRVLAVVFMTYLFLEASILVVAHMFPEANSMDLPVWWYPMAFIYACAWVWLLRPRVQKHKTKGGIN